MTGNYGGLLMALILIFNIFCLLAFLYLRFRKHDKNLDKPDDPDEFYDD